MIIFLHLLWLVTPMYKVLIQMLQFAIRSPIGSSFSSLTTRPFFSTINASTFFKTHLFLSEAIKKPKVYFGSSLSRHKKPTNNTRINNQRSVSSSSISLGDRKTEKKVIDSNISPGSHVALSCSERVQLDCSTHLGARARAA